MGIFVAIGVIGLIKFVDGQYPAITILVFDHGLIKFVKFRLLGKTILKDDVFRLLANNFDELIVGNLDLLSYRHDTKGKKIYMASFRQFLFNVNGEITNEKVIFQLESGKKVSLTKEGFLLPFEIKHVKDSTSLDETVLRGKQVALKIIQAMREARKDIEKQNPFWTAVIAYLPLMMIVIGIGVIAYFTITAAMNTAVQNAEVGQKIINACIG